MSALISGSVSLENLEKIVATLKAKNAKYFNFTTDVSNESKSFETSNGKTIYQNTSFYAEQTKEQREAKAKRFYFANGGVFWTDGKIAKAGPGADQPAQQQSAPPQQSAPSLDDLPF